MPKAHSIRAFVEKSCDSKSWKTVPILPAISATRRAAIDSPRNRTRPLKGPLKNRGTIPDAQRTRVDLPDPVGPPIPTNSPASISSEIPSRAKERLRR